MADLIHHLRSLACSGHPIGDEAADKIEALEGEVALLNRLIVSMEQARTGKTLSIEEVIARLS